MREKLIGSKNGLDILFCNLINKRNITASRDRNHMQLFSRQVSSRQNPLACSRLQTGNKTEIQIEEINFTANIENYFRSFSLIVAEYLFYIYSKI